MNASVNEWDMESEGPKIVSSSPVCNMRLALPSGEHIYNMACVRPLSDFQD